MENEIVVTVKPTKLKATWTLDPRPFITKEEWEVAADCLAKAYMEWIKETADCIELINEQK